MNLQLCNQIFHRSLTAVMAVTFLAVVGGCGQSRQETSTNTTTSSPVANATVGSESNSAPQPKIVTTFLPMYWFTKAVVGEGTDVEILIPPGTEIHEYQATPENVKAIATANILVANGLGLEEFLETTVKNAENKQLKQIDASQGIAPLQEISPVEKVSQEKHDHSHDHAAGNPHVWLDPVLAKQQVSNIRDGLIAADPGNRDKYQANASAYIQKLDQLHNQFQTSLQKNPNCSFITFHDAYPYLAKRYNLKQIAVVEIPEDQLAPQDIQNAIKAVKKYNVKVLFGEPGTENKLLDGLSQDLNLTLQPIDPLETGEKNPDYYFQAMQNNLKSLEKACQN